MVEKLEFKQYNFRILNFSYIFKAIEKDLIDDLHKYQLFKNRINSTAKKLFYHHIIFGVCNSLLNDKSKEKTIIYFNNQLGNFQIFKYFDEDEVLKTITVIVKKMKQLLPIKIFISSISFEFLAHLLQKNDGRSEELIANIRSYLNSINLERYTFSKVLTFTKKNDLVFLNKEFFNRLKAKQLIIV